MIQARKNITVDTRTCDHVVGKKRKVGKSVLIEVSCKSYLKGGTFPKDLKGYQYCLFRQDWNGSEAVYFNQADSRAVAEKVNAGKIIIHPNYSVLLCCDQKALDESRIFGVYKTVFDDNKNGKGGVNYSCR